MKNKTTALILSILLGGLGVDRFYLGYTGMGVLKLLTAGCFGILSIIDIINIATGKLQPADGSGYEDSAIFEPSRPQPQADPYDELNKLNQLRASEAITEEEFKKLKAACLAKIK